MILKRIFGSGVQAQGTYTYDGQITEIHADCAININVTPGKSNIVTYFADDNIIDDLDIRVENGVLSVSKLKKRFSWFKTNIQLNVSTDVLCEIKASGASEVVGKGMFTADTFRINASGASDVKMDITANDIILKVSGASDVKLTGRTESLTANVSGASDAELRNLVAENAKVNSSGASDLNVNVTKYLNATASGASDIRYWGSPELHANESGASDIKKGKGKVKTTEHEIITEKDPRAN